MKLGVDYQALSRGRSDATAQNTHSRAVASVEASNEERY